MTQKNWSFKITNFKNKNAKDAEVRKNIVDYEELVYDDRNDGYYHYAPKKERADPDNNRPQESQVMLFSQEDFKGMLDQSDEINGLLKALHSENEEKAKRGKKQIQHTNIEIPEEYHHENKFDESGQIVLDTEFERFIEGKQFHDQTGDHFRKLANSDHVESKDIKNESHGFENNNIMMSPKSKSGANLKSRGGVDDILEDFDW